jgi:hypothetical protein
LSTLPAAQAFGRSKRCDWHGIVEVSAPKSPHHRIPCAAGCSCHRHRSVSLPQPGANPSLTNPQNQTPHTLLLNAPYTHTVTVRGARTALSTLLSSHSRLRPAVHTSRHSSQVRTRTAQSQRAPGSSARRRERWPAWAPATQCWPSPGTDQADLRVPGSRSVSSSRWLRRKGGS